MKPFAAKLVLVLLPVFAMVGANVIVDPLHLLREGSEREAARMMAAGQGVAGLLNVDERLLVKYSIELRAAPLDVAVIGSSRAMQIGAGDFPHRSFFNSSVSAAVIEDVIAITGEYVRQRRLPTHLVIGLDPWLLNAHARHDGWRSLADSYRFMLDLMGLPADVSPLSVERYGAVLSPAYFQQLLRTVKAEGFRETPRQPRDTAEGALMPDGSRQYPRSVRDRTPEQTRQLAIAEAAAPLDSYAAGFRELDPWSQTRLEALVAFLQSHGTRVTFLLAPFHPELARRRRSVPEFQINAEAERYFRALAARRHIDVLGSYDADASGCGAEDLYDPSHPRPACLTKIFALRARLPDSLN
jgi:hypothetical protein